MGRFPFTLHLDHHPPLRPSLKAAWGGGHVCHWATRSGETTRGDRGTWGGKGHNTHAPCGKLQNRFQSSRGRGGLMLPFPCSCISKCPQHAVSPRKLSTLACACTGWAWLTFSWQLQGLLVPCSPEGVPLPWVSSQVEDERQLRVLLLHVGGDSRDILSGAEINALK